MLSPKCHFPLSAHWYAMLLAVKTAGVGNLTAAFADRDGRSAVPTDYCLMHE